MPHGGDTLPDELVTLRSELLLGPTLDGITDRLNEHDRGELRFAICAAPNDERVVLNFGIPIAWAALTYNEAIRMSEILRDKAQRLLRTEPES